MASSNDIEVLDPTATVEKLKNIVSKVALNRRHFMAALGVAGVAAGAGLGSGRVARAQQPTPNGFAQADVLNFLLNVKYLKATFYSFLTQGADLPGSSLVTLGSGQVYNQPAKIAVSGTFTAQFLDMFNEMYYDELNQLIDLQQLLGGFAPAGAAAARATMNLAGTSAANATFVAPSGATYTALQAIGQARMLEDLSVTAFAGALTYLTGTNLAYAAQVLAVDGCHAAALRLASIQSGAPYQGTLYQSTFQVATTSGSPTVAAVLASTAAVVGDIITGTGIPQGAVITAITPSANKTPTGVVISGKAVITAMSSIAGLAVGQPITGAGIPALTYITTPAPSGTTINISANASATPTAITPTGYLTSGSPTITGVSSLTGLIVGQPITASTTAIVVGQVLGTIPANTTITAASGTTITMSANASTTSSVSFTGILTSGSATIAPVSSTSGLAVGQAITDAAGNIPTTPATTITAIGSNITMSAKATASSPTTTVISFNGILTSGNANITLASSITGLVAGQPLTGAGITPGTTIKSAPSGTTVVMSANATASSTVTTTGSVASGSATITNVQSTTGMIVGQAITGAGIPASTNVSAIGTNTITMSKTATASPVAVTFNALTTAGSTLLTNVSSTTGLQLGQPLNGVGIPSTAIITVIGVSPPFTVTMSQAATATFTPTPFAADVNSGSNQLTSVSSIAGLVVGQAVLAASGIPANTIITAIGTNTITMSANASFSVPNGENFTTAEIITSPAQVTLSGAALEPIISGGSALTSPTLSTVSSPAAETLTIGQGTITISQNATATGSVTATIATSDPDEVVPFDPGTAPLAAVGPALDPSSSPPVYQGFFATAGANNATSTTPAGFAYARTFSQVLAVLYGNTATSTYEGGFYPVGVSGSINVV